MERKPVAGHAFLSYVREDSEYADRLQRALEESGIPVWRDTSDLWPGEDWRLEIRNAITDDALVFIACFSRNSLARQASYQNEELVLAVDQMRRRRPEQPWLIPVRFDESEVPDLEIGGGRMLSSLQWVDLFGDRFDEGITRLVAGILRILSPSAEEARRPQEHPGVSSPDVSDSEDRDDSAEKTAGQNECPRADAFGGRWRFTSDGFEATPLMNMVNTAMPGHPGLQDQSPFVRIGACVACDPVLASAGSSRIGSALVRFLGREPVSGLVSAITTADTETGWARLAGHGVIRLEAVFGPIADTGQPTASAMLLPPLAGNRMHGRADGIACLWLHFEPRNADGTVAPPASLADWHARMMQALSIAPAFAQFLAGDLGLTTSTAPATRIGVMLNAPRSMSELVDIGSLRVLPGAIASSQFLGYALTDPAGALSRDIAREMLSNLCEYTLHLDDYEPLLDTF